jgi:hypothetical protein
VPETTLVPAGGSTIVEFTLEVPGRYILVDHAFSRVEALSGLMVYNGISGTVEAAVTVVFRLVLSSEARLRSHLQSRARGAAHLPR